MDPNNEQGQAAPSLQHGCSTVDVCDDWVEVSGKKKHKIEKVLSDSFYVDDSNKTGKMDQGSPPFHDKNNIFGIFDDDSDPESVQDTLLGRENREPHKDKPKKKIKLEKIKMSTDDEDDDFDTGCQESIDQYIKQEMRTETFFKFENGMITRRRHPQKTTKTSPNCIVLSEKTLEEINISSMDKSKLIYPSIQKLSTTRHMILITQNYLIVT